MTTPFVDQQTRCKHAGVLPGVSPSLLSALCVSTCCIISHREEEEEGGGRRRREEGG